MKMLPAMGSALSLVLPLPAGAAQRAIDKSIDVPATLDDTWEAWTTREGIVSFFAPDPRSSRASAAPSTSTSIPARRKVARVPTTCGSWRCNPSRC